MSTPTQAVDLSAAVAAEIRALIARRMMTQAELAEKIGVSEMWVSRKARGRQVIDLNDLQRIADALGVNVVDLLPGSAIGRSPMLPVRPVPHLNPRPTTERPLHAGPNPAHSRPNTPPPEHGPRDRTRRPARRNLRPAA